MIAFEIKGLDKLKDIISAETVAKAVIATMQRLSRGAKTEASSAIRKKYTIKKKDLDKYIHTIRPRMREGSLVAGIRARGLRLGASYFAMNKSGVSFLQGESRSLHGGYVGKWRRQSNRLWVIRRLSNKPLRRESVLGPAVSDMLDDENVRSNIAKRIDRDAQAIFENQLWRLVQKG